MIYEFFAGTADYIGLSGVSLLLIAYFLLSTNKIPSQSLKYQLLNLIGALCVFYSLMFNFNLSSVVIEICWIIISLVGIYRVVSASRKSAPQVDNVFKFSNVKKK